MIKTGKELREYCKGKEIPIVFNNEIEQLEGRFETGMKAYITGVSEPDRDDLITINIEEKEFADFNKSMETPVWHNEKTSNFDLKYSESIYGEDWNGKDTIYDNENELSDNFTLLNNNKLQLYNQYLQEKQDKETYIDWLENKILNK